MPYVPQKKRKEILQHIEMESLLDSIEGKGDFSFLISQILTNILERDMRLSNGKCSYQKRAEWLGVVSDTYLEMRKRLLGIYEGKARERNGDLDNMELLENG